ncbi:protein kinase superfamily protein [Artemisia annua]|uniref:Protein kinase superfamily protein n=1 Tax=Artemisia annua TaxID=35608 RepID=A0A2U1PI75_ARTAN|nr:protein kinase superfamily protein [Artemisia annua]
MISEAMMTSSENYLSCAAGLHILVYRQGNRRQATAAAMPYVSSWQGKFRTELPFSLDPVNRSMIVEEKSRLPKYPPSKKFDAKMRDEEDRRQTAAGGKVHRPDPERKATRKSRAVPAPEANAEFASFLHLRRSSGGLQNGPCAWSNWNRHNRHLTPS